LYERSYGQFILALTERIVHYGLWRTEDNMTTMAILYQWARQLRTDRRGQDMIEYALVAALVVVIVASGLAPWIGPTLVQIFSKVGSVLGSTP
jgi:Flp pilus assembly pilin Flp